jgi:hypothetical protein
MSSQKKRNQKRNIDRNQKKKSQELSIPGTIVQQAKENTGIYIYIII